VGFVRREHGAGIRGATISVGDQQTQTNTAGAYALTLEVGSYTVTVSAEDYDTQVITDVTISPNQNTTLNVVLSPVANEDDIVPVTATVLKGNSPNPFNPETTIYYDLLDAGKVRLDVYNVKGQKVRTLVNTEKQSGRHSVVFDARDDNGRALSSGVYIYRFNSGKYSSTKKMMLME
jgi:5-hydroxyisourate hydrolase-like protein (transthyretin family)